LITPETRRNAAITGVFELSKRLNSPEVTAERLGVSKPTLARWRCTKQGPAFVKIGGKVGYLDADIDAFIDCNRRTGTAERGRVA
jgi:predicted DNA-binding transcriptional regulator AlpA